MRKIFVAAKPLILLLLISSFFVSYRVNVWAQTISFSVNNVTEVKALVDAVGVAISTGVPAQIDAAMRRYIAAFNQLSAGDKAVVEIYARQVFKVLPGRSWIADGE